MADHLASEVIPDSALLFRRIHRHFFDPETGRVMSGAFDGQDMSADWEKYSTPTQTAERDTSGNTVAVASLTAALCRNLEQTVLHDPLPGHQDIAANPAHTLVRGRKSKPTKQKLRDLAILAWKKE
jgi:hypothetical protein